MIKQENTPKPEPSITLTFTGDDFEKLRTLASYDCMIPEALAREGEGTVPDWEPFFNQLQSATNVK